MENNLLKNFLTIQEFREERPRLSIMNDEQVQEAINIATDLLDGICNGLISMVVQYSLGREVKDPNHPLFRTDFEMLQIKKAMVFQTHYVLNLGNDYTIGSQSMSTGGINYAGQRPESRQEIAPAVKEFLARARVFEITNVGGANSSNITYKECNWLKTLLTQERGDDRYLQKFQPNAVIGSIASIGEGNTITFINPKNTEWNTIRAKQILDIDGEYRAIDKVIDLAFFGKGMNKAMTRQEIYNAIWNSLFWNEDVSYPNEAIVKVYDRKNNLVYTFKSQQDNNLGHNPLRDENKDEFWWKKVNVPESVNYDDIASLVITSKEFLQAINRIKDEFDGTLSAFWEQIKDNEHLLKKFEELYDQSKTENEQLENKLTPLIEANKTAIDGLNKDNIAYKNKDNDFVNQSIRGDVPYLSFKAANGVRVAYVGNPSASNNDIETKSEHGNNYVSARDNVYLNPINGNAIYNKAPTADNHVVNKKYVDDKVGSGGGNVNLDNVPKLVGDNRFEGNNHFEGLTTIGANVTISGYAGYIDPNTVIQYDFEFANKKYVDSKMNISLGGSFQNALWNKYDLVSDTIWKYELNVSYFNIPIPVELQGKNIRIHFTIGGVEQGTNVTPVGMTLQGEYSNVSSQVSFSVNQVTILSPFDYNPGTTGNFPLKTSVTWIIIERE